MHRPHPYYCRQGRVLWYFSKVEEDRIALFEQLPEFSRFDRERFFYFIPVFNTGTAAVIRHDGPVYLSVIYFKRNDQVARRFQAGTFYRDGICRGIFFH